MHNLSVYQWPLPEGKNGQQAVEILQKRVEQLGATKTGTFCVDCETYQSSLGPNAPTKNVFLVHNTEHPATTFAVLESGLVLVADSLLDIFMLKLNGAYNLKKNANIESKGQRYEQMDFVIKIGSVSIGPSFKGILVEVEYQPCDIPASCFDLMREFMQGFIGPSVQLPPQLVAAKIAEPYTPKDTVQQYLDHFNSLRRTTAAGPPTRMQ
ncbi:PREDICTED: mediator of RNA polymerase II transcription subunit 20-like [Priapulus caudatus]|uniref:Mediator of RNA polymerase II transcription subunit 20 n=1 Tax=Priapulus caudatus TaxID=37621 RepID=A0ABM1F270_PRICU|nr:PREDICTED: mediator of RNA polymerase II transcription subunit 20-like [Priapulus caudatus]